MNQIVNISTSLGIGKDGELLCHIPEDMSFFKEMTLGKTVVMGRKTLESFPSGRPLKGRKNIVLTKNIPSGSADPSHGYGESLDGNFNASIEKARSEEDLETELIYVCSLSELFSVLPEDSSNVFVIGGESIYRLLLPHCDTFYVTVNDCKGEADTFYPDLSKIPELKLISRSEEKHYKDINYRFLVYKRI